MMGKVLKSVSLSMVFAGVFLMNGNCTMTNNPLLGDKEAVIQYATAVKTGAIYGFNMTDPINNINVFTLNTEEEKAKVMANLALASYYVPTERTDFQVVCSTKMLNIAETISDDGTPNYKILVLLLKSQLESNLLKFKDNASSEVVGNIFGRFESLVNGDAQLAEAAKKAFKELLKNDSRFALYAD
jgi:hypothetical protein